MVTVVNSYDIGDVVWMTGRFFDEDDEPASPSDVTLYVLEPDGTETPIEFDDLEPLSEGVFEGSFSPTQWGDHSYYFRSDEFDSSTPDTHFYVNKSRHPSRSEE